MVSTRDGRTPTEDDPVVESLRQQGILGPFTVTDWHADSDIGAVRSVNEDRWLADAQRGFVLADGMGGFTGGAQAADIAVSHVFEALDQLGETSARGIVDRTSAVVAEYGGQHGFDKLGSTLCALANRRTHVIVLHVGDSRVYRCRDGELELLTRDHSVRAELLAAGVPLEAAIQSNVQLDALTSYIGRQSDLASAMAVASFSVAAGDRFLLCTDGVHAQISFDDIEAAMQAATCAEAVDQLIDGTRSAGGRDNATAIAVTYGNEVGLP